MSFVPYRFFRFSRKLQPFDSPQLDVLAERMGVLRQLDRKHRYFLSSRGYSAFSFPGGIAFGRAFWNAIDDGERLAIAAHEFSHIKSRDMEKRFLRIVLPPVVVTLAVMIPLITLWVNDLPDSETLLAFIVVAVGTAALYSSTYTTTSLLGASWRRRMELSCDEDAARFTNGEDLIRALSLWHDAADRVGKKNIRTRIQGRFYPSLAERAAAVRAVTRAQSPGSLS